MRASHIAQWAFSALVALVGADLALRGSQLISLGGSWYYMLAGIGLLVIAGLTVSRSPWAPRVYALLLATTLAWAFAEAGLDLLGLLPRLAAFLAAGLWFAMPWTRTWFRNGADTKPFRWTEIVSALGVALLAASTFQGYRVEHMTLTPVAGEASADWRAYGNGPGGQRFVATDQINARNVAGLQEAWRFRTGVAFDFKDTPLEADGLLYICTAGNTLIALDADTGQQRWRHDTATRVPGGIENATSFARTCRGLAFHETADATGQCAKRVLGGTVDGRLIAVDAATGEACRDFGFGGEVNLNTGLGPHPEGEYMVTSPPLVAGSIVVVGGWVSDNQRLGNVSGVVRAYDAVTGRFAWAWDLGRAGEHGQPGEGGEYTRGTPNVWSIMSYDPQLNLIYAPTGNSSPDYFGGDLRSRQAEEYSSSIVAIDAATGEPRWHFQTVHHDVWDYDVPSQPVLVDLGRDGARVPSVVVPTKRGEIFVLDRRTGQPVWPIEERPVPQGGEPGERLSPTQPFSSLPNFRTDLTEADMWGLTPLDQLACRIAFRRLRYEGHFTPPTRGGSLQYPGDFGGFNWGSVSVDPDNGLLVAAPMMVATHVTLLTSEDRAARRAAELAEAARRGLPPPEEKNGHGAYSSEGDPRFDQSRVLYTSEVEPFMSPWTIPGTHVSTQLPCTKPPYGALSVIDLNTGRMMWRRPLGSMKDSGPFGRATGLPFMVGAPLQGGSMTTRGGLIFHGGAMDSTFRAFDIRTGEVRWQAGLPGSAQATPMSYTSPQTGKQYVVITVPNPSWRFPWPSDQPTDGEGGYVIAYALPDAVATNRPASQSGNSLAQNVHR
jgi:membrane-bound PQQ-dependent dehydrogenase (glucose/quinate/shikimate family)